MVRTMRPATVLLSIMALAATGCARTAEPAATSSVAPGRTCTYAVGGSPAKPVDPPNGTNVAATGTVTATLTLDGQKVTITMDRSTAPCAVNSFESLAKQGWYDDMACHRLVEQGIFVLQCGDPTGTGSGGPGYAYADELSGSEKYTAGTVAMANGGPDTNGSQFFLVWADSPLPPKYTVLGHMDAASTAVIAGIAGEGVALGSEKPNAPAKISTVTLG